MSAAVLALVLTLQPAAAPAQERDRAAYDSLVREIGNLQEELARYDQQAWGLTGRLERLSLESALHRRELSRLAIERSRATASLQAAGLALDERERELAQREASLAGHLRDLYRMGREREVRLLLALKEPGDLLRGLAYLDYLSRRQAGAVAEARQARERLQAQRRALGDESAGLESLIQRESALAAAAEARRIETADLLESIRQDQGAHRQAIDELARAARVLEETILQGLATTPGAPLLDVGRLKGAIEWPVIGRVARPFGEIRHPRFGTSTPHPGIDFAVEPGAPIRACLPGRVLFSGRISGYGNTVILDHSGHYLTVYSRLARPGVSQGQDVAGGQELGVAAEESFDGGPPTVYFEFRRDGRPEDPAGWLKRKPAQPQEHR